MPRYFLLDLDHMEILSLGQHVNFDGADAEARKLEADRWPVVSWILNEDSLCDLASQCFRHLPLVAHRIPIPDGDYALTEGAAWLDVKGFAVRVHSTDEGMVVDVFDAKALAGGDTEAIVASTYAFDSDLGEGNVA